MNNGQSCIAAKRFIVAEPIADEFERRFVAKMEALKVGDPFDDKTELGPLATPDAVHDLDADVQKTVKAGAKGVDWRATRSKRPGNFYAPTVLTNIPKNSPAYGEELFGPVASIFRVKDIDEAIQHRQRHPLRSRRERLDQRPASANASSTKSKPGWSSSTRWWLPIRAFHSAA